MSDPCRVTREREASVPVELGPMRVSTTAKVTVEATTPTVEAPAALPAKSAPVGLRVHHVRPRVRGAGRPGGRPRRTSASRASPDDDSGDDGPGGAGPDLEPPLSWWNTADELIVGLFDEEEAWR